MNYLTLASLLLAIILSGAACLHIQPGDIDYQLLSCYDFIVVGGGVSGLVVARRLAENPKSNKYPVLSQNRGIPLTFIFDSLRSCSGVRTIVHLLT